MHPSDLGRLFLQALMKQLPPSASTLRLLDVGGMAGGMLAQERADLDIIPVPADPGSLPADSLDAIVVYGAPLSDALLRAGLSALRPGGRLIALDPEGRPGPALVERLERAGYVRILVENAAEAASLVGVLMRGEKPHTSANTLERIHVAADRDLPSASDIASVQSRYFHLLVEQTPNKPVWALAEGEAVTWRALGLVGDDGQPRVLTFTSLPKAVAFMQPAVLAGLVRGVNKVGKFSRAAAQAWTFALLVNPEVDMLAGRATTWMDIDAATAEAPDE